MTRGIKQELVNSNQPKCDPISPYSSPWKTLKPRDGKSSSSPLVFCDFVLKLRQWYVIKADAVMDFKGLKLGRFEAALEV